MQTHVIILWGFTWWCLQVHIDDLVSVPECAVRLGWSQSLGEIYSRAGHQPSSPSLSSLLLLPHSPTLSFLPPSLPFPSPPSFLYSLISFDVVIRLLWLLRSYKLWPPPSPLPLGPLFWEETPYSHLIMTDLQRCLFLFRQSAGSLWFWQAELLLEV